MRNLALLVALLAVSAWAGDELLGVILVTDGGTVSNATTGYGSPGCSKQTDPEGAGACAQAFPIGTGMLLSIQCKDQGALVRVNRFKVDAGDGARLATDQWFQTSTGTQAVSVGPLLWGDGGTRTASGMPDGGTYLGGVVAIAPLPGLTRAECNINNRNGNE